MKLTLDNGVTLEGTPEQIYDVAKKLGYESLLEGQWYNSSSKGLLRIKDMETHHIKNALLKMYSEFVQSLYKAISTEDLIKLIIVGPSSKTFLALLKELKERNSKF